MALGLQSWAILAQLATEQFNEVSFEGYFAAGVSPFPFDILIMEST